MMLWLLQHIPSFVIYLILAAGTVAYLVSSFIPFFNSLPTRTIGLALLLVGAFLQGLNWGADVLSADVDKANAEIKRINDESKNVTEKIVTQYVIKQKVIKEKGDETIKYVNTKNDADCTLHNSFVELHDSAAKNSIPDPTGAVDETSSGIELSEAKKVIIENYYKYNEVAEQLKDLQEWVRQQRELNK